MNILYTARITLNVSQTGCTHSSCDSNRVRWFGEPATWTKQLDVLCRHALTELVRWAIFQNDQSRHPGRMFT